jgi:putative acetyltransferase
MDIRPDDLSSPDVQALLEEHLRHMHSLSPAESVHALDRAALRQPGVTFWSAWSGSALVGCGALKELDPLHGEVKSMRTAAGYRRLSLETGAQPAFEPARRLYERFGFQYCPPFDGYTEDPNSVFMTRAL